MSLFGDHTADELRDLVKAKDYDIGQVQAAADAAGAAWQASDPLGYSDWLADWKRFRDRYAKARTTATIKLTAADILPGPDSLKPVEGAWQGILRALSVVDGVQTKGDFQELHNRLVAATNKPVDFSKQPTPIAHDTDLAVYHAADTGVRAIEAGEKAAKKAAGGFFAENWPWIAGIAVGAIAVNAAVKKIV